MATLVELTASIVESHASTTGMSTQDLLREIQRVYETLKQLEKGAVEPASVEEKEITALTVKQAFKQNEVICMICGKSGMKTLTRHLSQAHGMKPGEYRRRFGIPGSQALAAKRFSEERRKMAQERGMGDILAKAREKRMANIRAKKTASKKPVRAKATAKTKQARVLV